MPPPPAAPPPPPRSEGRYRHDRRLGQGAFGTVYLAQDTHLDRPVALKYLHAKVEDDTVRARFHREAAVTARLAHPNVVAVLDYGEDPDGKLFIAYEYVDGPSLKQRLADGPLDPGLVTSWGAQLADALAAAHDLGVLHRDIKPANILVGPGDQPRLCDFGLAQDSSATQHLTATGELVGTLSYLAPELFRGGLVGAASDQFSLAATLFEAGFGRRFRDQGDYKQALRGEFPAHLPVEPGPGQAALHRALTRALQPDPDHRFPDMAGFRDALLAPAGEPGHARAPGVATFAAAAPAPGTAPPGAAPPTPDPAHHGQRSAQLARLDTEAWDTGRGRAPPLPRAALAAGAFALSLTLALLWPSAAPPQAPPEASARAPTAPGATPPSPDAAQRARLVATLDRVEPGLRPLLVRARKVDDAMYRPARDAVLADGFLTDVEDLVALCLEFLTSLDLTLSRPSADPDRQLATRALTRAAGWTLGGLVLLRNHAEHKALGTPFSIGADLQREMTSFNALERAVLDMLGPVFDFLQRVPPGTRPWFLRAAVEAMMHRPGRTPPGLLTRLREQMTAARDPREVYDAVAATFLLISSDNLGARVPCPDTVQLLEQASGVLLADPPRLTAPQMGSLPRHLVETVQQRRPFCPEAYRTPDAPLARLQPRLAALWRQVATARGLPLEGPIRDQL